MLIARRRPGETLDGQRLQNYADLESRRCALSDLPSAETRRFSVRADIDKSPNALGCGRSLVQWRWTLRSGGQGAGPSGLARKVSLPWEGGFSLVELAFTLAIICIVVVVVFEAYANAYPAFRATSAVQLLQSQLRQAREVSIDQRRSVQVTFKGTAELVAVVQGINGGSNTQIYDYFLPEGLKYVLLSGVPDTPDGYGNSYAVNYNCPSNTLPCTITFQSDGSVLDGGGAYANGSIFIGITGQAQTARAVTILSATGRIKDWSYNGSAWH
jgi:type II secretory pathway pseudopilin PulG